MPPCPRCPFNGGNPFQPTAASAGSEGPLTGEVRRMALHRRSHQPRPLFGSRQAYYPDHRFFMMIAHYLTPSRPVCQFLFCIFQCFSSFFMSAPPEPPVPGAGLPHVYQMSTKKWCQSLGAQGIGKTSLRGWSTRCLPFSLFYVKSACLEGFPPDFHNFWTPCKGRDTAATGPESRKTSKNLDKIAKIVSKMLNLPGLPFGTVFQILSRKL